MKSSVKLTHLQYNSFANILDLCVCVCVGVLTDFTLCPMPIMSLPSFFILLTNSIGSMPLSNALLNCLAAASRAPPKRSP